MPACVPRPPRTTRTTGSCDVGGAPREPLAEAGWLGGKALGDVLVVHARVGEQVAGVELRFLDGRTRAMDVAAGHAVATVPRDAGPLILVAKDAAGDVVGTAAVPALPPGRRPPCPGVCTGGAGNSVVSRWSSC